MRYPRGDYCLFDQYVPRTTPEHGSFHHDFWNKLGTGIIKNLYGPGDVHSFHHCCPEVDIDRHYEIDGFKEKSVVTSLLKLFLLYSTSKSCIETLSENDDLDGVVLLFQPTTRTHTHTVFSV